VAITPRITKGWISLSAIFCATVCLAQARRPVGAWDFNSQQEIVRDKTGNGNDLRVEGCDWAQTKLGKVLRVPFTTARIWCETAG
jgi:hypothetical protein